VALGEKLKDMGYGLGLLPFGGVWGVKVPVFSTDKLPGIDPKLGPRMTSTGESLGLGCNLADALTDGLKGAGWRPPQRGRILMSVADAQKSEVMPVAMQFRSMGWFVDATGGTASYLTRWGIDVKTVLREELNDKLRHGEWDLVLNIPGGGGNIHDGVGIRSSASSAGVPCLHSIQAALAVANSFLKNSK